MKTSIWANKGGLLAAFLVLAVTAFVVRIGGPRLYAASGDLMLHYDLANSIAHTWIWPPWGKPLDSGMANYPPIAHYLAAIAGKPFDSALLGLNIVSVLCVFGSYLILADALFAGSLAGSAVALAIAAAVLNYGRYQHAVIGFEVFWNAFYAQMVGVFAFLAFTYWLCRSQARWSARLAVTAIVTVLCGWLYTIAAVQVAMAYLCLEGLRGLRMAMAEKRVTLAMIAPAAAGAAILPPLIVFHPVFGPMVQTASNDGGVDLMLLNRAIPGLAIALLVVCLGIGLFGRATARWRAGGLFIATAGLATAAPAILQLAARVLLHVGSDYAVKKYGFSVVTMLAFSLGAVAAATVELRPRRALPRPAGLVLASLAAAVVALKLGPFAPIRLDGFIRYQRAIQAALTDASLPGDIRGKVMSRNHAYPWFLNHASSVVDLGSRAQRSFDAATHPDWEFTEREQAAYVFIENNDKTVPARCILKKPDIPDIALISTSCFMASSFELEPGASLDMAKLTRRPAYFTSGWSGKEATGFWNDGKAAKVAVHVDSAPDPMVLTFDAGVFLAAPTSVQHVAASVDGHPVGQWVFDAKTAGGPMTVRVPRALMRNGVAAIDFAFPDAVSPAERKISTDARQLAVFIRGMSVGGSKPLHLGDTVSLAEASGKPGQFQDGWSGKEAGWIWNDGDHASISILPDDVSTPLFLTFNGAAFIPGKGAQQRVEISVAGRQVGRWTFDDASPEGDRTVTIPRELLANGEVKLDFAFPDAVAPAERHLSADTRKLAYQVRSFTVGDPKRPLRAGDTWPVKPGSGSPIKFGKGWADQEPAGRWTDGKHASLFLRVEKSRQAVDLTIDANAFIARAGMAQRVGVSASGRHLADWTYDDKSQSGPRTVSIPGSLIKPDGELALDFDLPDATSPAESRISGDPRHLGLFVKSLSLGPQASR